MGRWKEARADKRERDTHLAALDKLDKLAERGEASPARDLPPGWMDLFWFSWQEVC